MQRDSCLYSQWFPGSENIVADSLSRDFHNKLTLLLTSIVPHQLPHGLNLKPLPREIASWLTLQLQQQPAPKQSPTKPQQSKIAPFAAGLTSVRASTSAQTSSLTTSPEMNASGSSVVSPKRCMKEDLVQTIMNNWQQEQYKRLLATYLQLSGLMVEKNPTYDNDHQLSIILH